MKRKLKLELHTRVEKPLADVFLAFIDPAYTTRVDPPTRSAKLVHGTGYEKGDVWKLEIDGGIIGTIHQKRTYLQVDPPRSFTVQVEQKGLRGTDTQRFEVLADGSVEVTWKPKYELTGVMALLFPVVKRQVKSKGKLWMKLMKKAIESDRYPIRRP